MSRKATVLNFSENMRTCKNCIYYEQDICTYPNGWTLDDKNRCEQFKRKERKAEGDEE